VKSVLDEFSSCISVRRIKEISQIWGAPFLPAHPRPWGAEAYPLALHWCHCKLYAVSLSLWYDIYFTAYTKIVLKQTIDITSLYSVCLYCIAVYYING